MVERLYSVGCFLISKIDLYSLLNDNFGNF